MFWAADKNASVIFADPLWRDWTGQHPEDAKGEGWAAQVHEQDRALALGTLQQASVASEMFSVNYRLVRPEGGYRWVKASGAPSVSPDSRQFIGYLGTLDAITRPSACYASADVGSQPLYHLEGCSPELIDEIAGQIIAARALAEKARERRILNVLDLALIEVGFRLAREIEKKA